MNNRQQKYYGLNNNQKYRKPSAKNKTTKDKKSLFPKNDINKNNIINQFDNYNKSYIPSQYKKNKKNLNQEIRDYQLFVKKYFGDTTPIASMTEERMNELFKDQEVNNKIILDNENDIEFQKLLKDNEDLDFGEEDCLIPSNEEFIYDINDKLGKHKNNKNDYFRREKLLFKNEKKVEKEPEIKEEPKNEEENNNVCNDLEKKEEEEEPKNEEENNEYNDFEEKEEEKKDKEKKEEEKEEKEEEKEDKEEKKEEKEEPKLEKSESKEEKKPLEGKNQELEMIEYLKKQKEKNAKKIQKIYKEKKKGEKLYIGFDDSKSIILRIYVNEYDQYKKVKSIKIFSYFIYQKKELILEKTIKDLLGVEPLSVNTVKKFMDKIIERALLQNEDSIDNNLLNEIQKEEQKEKNENDVKISVRNKCDKEELEKNDNLKESQKEEFVIENNDENIKEENNKNKDKDNDSSIEDVDYGGFD